ncbi:hypothetical protein HD806DRAFT_475946 [Xylariaceae sp. AK1471]|nr:hypothetical protein HD806DRAFT_475946 [Xylariaceae sp. AK1471]
MTTMSRSGRIQQPAASLRQSFNTLLLRMRDYTKPSKMSATFIEQEEASQASAWGSIRQHHNEIETAASRLNTIKIEAAETDSSHHYALSALELFPEEVLLAIMKYLDYESLYCLSQTTGYFLRLSFDSVFESDPAWRAFRHTVDGLSDGPSRRVLDGIKCQARTAAMSQESPVLSGPARIHETESSGTSKPIQQPSREASAKLSTKDEQEAETMLEFMARRS